MLFQPAGNWILILLEQQRLLREVWMDGRELCSICEVHDGNGKEDSSKMRNPLTGAILSLGAMLVLSSVASAQTAQSQPKQGNEVRSPWKYYPMDRAVGDGGPAKKRDLTGTWAGPGSGAAVPKGTNAQAPTGPPLTPLGKQLYDQNKPIGKYSPAGTNDPHTRYCDPFGFPQNMTNEIRGMTIATLPDRTFILIQYMDVWREIWTDGRALPTNVASGKDGLDPKLNGYSVGHWEGNTLVVDTTNFRRETSLPGSSANTHLIERFTRTDANTLLYEFTVDDPTMWTRPWTAVVPMTKSDDPIYEYACHEGNYAMSGILAGARAAEKAAAEAGKSGSK